MANRVERWAQAAKKRRWIAAIWRKLRRFAVLQQLAARLRGAGLVPDARELPAGAALPPNEAFLGAREQTRLIEGMFSDFSMAVVDSLLACQAEAGVGGDMLELGVFKGRSAALIGRHLKGAERLLLVDIIDYLDRRAIAPFRKSVDLIISPTEELRTSFIQYQNRLHSFRFIHIDASHNYRATFGELEMADDLLGPRGIVALDDFANLNYSQNIAAIFKYIYTTGTDLTPFLVTDEKAYLCRRGDLAFYAAFVLERLIAQMASRGIADVMLARTDLDPEYRATYARARGVGEEGRYYGFEIENYRKNYQQI